MLKGVNKLIIEVNNTECEYFERAIFFVKPDKGDIPASELVGGAEELIKKNVMTKRKRPPNLKLRRSGAVRYIAGLVSMAGVGAFIYALLTNIL